MLIETHDIYGNSVFFRCEEYGRGTINWSIKVICKIISDKEYPLTIMDIENTPQIWFLLDKHQYSLKYSYKKNILKKVLNDDLYNYLLQF